MKCKCAECGITKFRLLREQQQEQKLLKQKKVKGLLLGRNSPFNKIPLIGAIL